MAKRKRMFESPEERAAWQAKWDENQRELQRLIARAKAELAERHRSAG
jgi:hypothetical protein